MRNGKEELINRYFSGECTEKEKKQVEAWLQAKDEETLSLIDRAVADVSNKIPDVPVDLVNIWHKVHEEIAIEGRNRQLSVRHWLAIAASITLLMASFFVFWQQYESPATTPQLSYVTKSTQQGENLTVQLPDGTKVKLNSSSSLKYAENFDGGETRTVELKGEAFFDVMRNEARPFVIKTGDVRTTVLGTSFNVNARKESTVKVAVVSGKVEVAKDPSSVIITAGEMALSDEELTSMPYDFDTEIGWKNGLLILKGKDFMEIIDDLEEWYGVEIEVNGKITETDINVSYQNESLEEVLEGLSFAANFDYIIDKKNVKLTVK
jgi:transmembrane sensor